MRALALAAGIALAALAPAPAQASRPGVTPTSACVSGWEFENLANGTPRAEAERFLDGPGRPVGSPRIVAYRSCAGPWRRAQVVVRYVDGRVFGVYGLRVDRGALVVPPRAP